MLRRVCANLVARCRRKASTGGGDENQAGGADPRTKTKNTEEVQGQIRKHSRKGKQSKKKANDAPAASAIAIALDLSWEKEWGVDEPATTSDPNGLNADLVNSIVRPCLIILVWVVYIVWLPVPCTEFRTLTQDFGILYFFIIIFEGCLGHDIISM